MQIDRLRGNSAPPGREEGRGEMYEVAISAARRVLLLLCESAPCGFSKWVPSKLNRPLMIIQAIAFRMYRGRSPVT